MGWLDVETTEPDAPYKVKVTAAPAVPGLTTAKPVEASSAGVNARGKFRVDWLYAMRGNDSNTTMNAILICIQASCLK